MVVLILVVVGDGGSNIDEIDESRNVVEFVKNAECDCNFSAIEVVDLNSHDGIMLWIVHIGPGQIV
ncbi:hypothetical protein AHAS_Ahas16G0276200 [Arachis hypogaea]